MFSADAPRSSGAVYMNKEQEIHSISNRIKYLYSEDIQDLVYAHYQYNNIPITEEKEKEIHSLPSLTIERIASYLFENRITL